MDKKPERLDKLEKLYEAGFGIENEFLKKAVVKSVKHIKPTYILGEGSSVLDMMNSDTSFHFGIWEDEDLQNFCLIITKYDKDIKLQYGRIDVPHTANRESTLIITHIQGKLKKACYGDYFEKVAGFFKE